MVLPRCGFVPVDKDDVLGLRLTIVGVLHVSRYYG
jgi:hypothetical protein